MVYPDSSWVQLQEGKSTKEVQDHRPLTNNYKGTVRLWQSETAAKAMIHRYRRKWILTLDMLLGRLEIYAIILFATIRRWK